MEPKEYAYPPVPTYSKEKETNEFNQCASMDYQLPDSHFQDQMFYIHKDPYSELFSAHCSQSIKRRNLLKKRKRTQLTLNSCTSTSVKQNKTDELNQSNSLPIISFCQGSNILDQDGANQVTLNFCEQVAYYQPVRINSNIEKHDKITFSESKMDKIIQSSSAVEPSKDSPKKNSLANSSRDLSEYFKHYSISVSQAPEGSFVITEIPACNVDKRSDEEKTLDLLFSYPIDIYEPINHAQDSPRLRKNDGKVEGNNYPELNDSNSDIASDKNKSMVNSAISTTSEANYCISPFSKICDLNSNTISNSVQKSKKKSRTTPSFLTQIPAREFCAPRGMKCNDMLHAKSIHGGNSMISSPTTEMDCTSQFYASNCLNNMTSDVAQILNSTVSSSAAIYDSTERLAVLASNDLNNNVTDGLTSLATPSISTIGVKDHTITFYGPHSSNHTASGVTQMSSSLNSNDLALFDYLY